MSDGTNIEYQTTSDTALIDVGYILAASAGAAIATTVPSVEIPIIGVAKSKVAALTTAAESDIAVQISGPCTCKKESSAPIALGAIVSAAATATVGGITMLVAASGTTAATGSYCQLGRCTKAATTSDTEVDVYLNLGC